MPLIGGGGHWCAPELSKHAAENLEGVIVALANWPGKKRRIGKRFMRTDEPWFGHDSIFAYAHVMILKEAMEHAGAADRHKVAAAMRDMDMTDGPALFFPDGRLNMTTKAAASAPSFAWCSGATASRRRSIRPRSPPLRRAVAEGVTAALAGRMTEGG